MNTYSIDPTPNQKAYSGGMTLGSFNLDLSPVSNDVLDTLRSSLRSLDISTAINGGLRIVAMGAAPLSMSYGQVATTAPAQVVLAGNRRRTGWQLLPSGASGSQVIPMLTAAISHSLQTQKESLLTLEPGWDGYGAAPLEPQIIEELLVELKDALSGVNGRPPELVPGSDGTLQAEWYLPSMLVFYQITEDRDRFLFVVATGTGEDHVYEGREARKALREVVRAIRKADDLAKSA